MENERVLEIYTSQQQKYDGYRDGGRKEETNKTKVWGVRERAYIKAWWIRNSTPSCGRLRRRSYPCWEEDRMKSLGTPRHRRPSRNRTSKSSVHGSAAGHDWVRPAAGQGGGCEARRKPRLEGTDEIDTECLPMWVGVEVRAGTCVGAVVTGAGTSTVLGLVETRHAVVPSQPKARYA